MHWDRSGLLFRTTIAAKRCWFALRTDRFAPPVREPAKMLITLMIATGILLVVALFMGCLFPLVSLVECGLSKDHTGVKKVFWILAHLLFWALAAVLYGLFATQSDRLHGFTKKAVLLLLICFGVVAGIGYQNPEIRAEMLERFDSVPALAESTGQRFGVELPDLKPTVEDAQAEVLELQEVSLASDSESPRQSGVQNAHTLRTQALDALQKERLERAQGLIEAAVRRDATSIENLIARARIYQVSGQVDVARQQWQELLASLTDEISRKPTSAKLHYQRGTCFQSMQNASAALADFRTAVKLNPVEPTYRAALTALEAGGGRLSSQRPTTAAPASGPTLPPASPVYRNLRDNPFVE